MTKEQEELNKAIEEAANDTPTTISMKSFKAGALTALTTESIYSKARLEKREDDDGFFDDTDQPIHLWFELSYAQYLTVPRSIMEAMPIEWQRKMAKLLQEMDETFNWRPEEGRYWVKLKDDKGRYVQDPLMEYRRPNKAHIESIRQLPAPPKQ